MADDSDKSKRTPTQVHALMAFLQPELLGERGLLVNPRSPQGMGNNTEAEEQARAPRLWARARAAPPAASPRVGNWTAKIEYLYLDLGTVTTIPAPAPNSTTAVAFNSRITDSIVRVGANYKFDPNEIWADF